MKERTEEFYEGKTYNHEIITSDEKSLTVLHMLENKQRVNYQIFSDMFGATLRTFRRVISTIRRSYENAGIYETQIFYNHNTRSYELVKAHFIYPNKYEN